MDTDIKEKLIFNQNEYIRITKGIILNYIERLSEKFKWFEEKSIWLFRKSLQTVYEIYIKTFGDNGLDLVK